MCICNLTDTTERERALAAAREQLKRMYGPASAPRPSPAGNAIYGALAVVRGFDVRKVRS